MSNDFGKRFVFYCNNNEMNQEISNQLKWEISLKNEFLNKRKKQQSKPKSSLLADNDSDSDNENEIKNDNEQVCICL